MLYVRKDITNKLKMTTIYFDHLIHIQKMPTKLALFFGAQLDKKLTLKLRFLVAQRIAKHPQYSLIRIEVRGAVI